MVLAAKNSPLVSGAAAGSRPAPSVGWVRLLRAICIKGERVEADTVLQLDRITASELISANKAERAPQQSQAPVQTSGQATKTAEVKKPAAAAAATPPNKDTHHVR